ncbi:MAG: preprotein translocase subunit YajC [Pelagibacterales bacterium]|nr:preprotein translocase subunit YajC [Pelagibacterales bacterium]
MLINDAFAQASEAPQQEISFSSFIPLILIFAVFYFLIIRPQSKKYKEHQEMVNNLKTGTKVVTSGGIVGVVQNIYKEENLVEIEVAPGVSVKLLKNYVSEMVKDEKSEKISKKKGKKA